MTRQIVVSVHDVAPSTAESSRRWVEILDSMGVRASLLVVGGPWQGKDLTSSDEFCRWLDAAERRGHEIVQHGWCHSHVKGNAGLVRRLAGNFIARGCQEFWELSYEDASTHLLLGREAMAQSGFRADGFVAPGWMMSPGTVSALKHLGYSWTTTHTRVISLSGGTSMFMPVVSQRPGGFGTGFTASAVRLAGAALTSGGRPYRVALHPNDLADSRARISSISVINRALGAGYETLTYGELLRTRGNDNVAHMGGRRS